LSVKFPFLSITKIREYVMNSKRAALLFVVCLSTVISISLGWVSTAISVEYLEEFNDSNLDPEVWEIKAEGDASYKIENGQLTLTSPDVADGILLYWRGSEIDVEDFSVEIKATVAQGTNNAAVAAFIKTDLPPIVNSTINPEWKTVIWCGSDNSNWYINNDDWKRSDAEGPELEGIWKISVEGNNILCYFNGAEVTAFEKIQEDRFLCFGPDTYTSHYSGEMTIDWIKMSGPSMPTAAVDPAKKLSTVWGSVKSAL